MLSLNCRALIKANKLLLFFTGICLLFVNVGNAQAASKRKVLILNSYHKEFKWTDSQETAAKETLHGGINPTTTLIAL
jgi:hypothetical protein